MRRFETYTDIRKKALIFGLSVTFFAFQMIFLIGSLLLIIFSFSIPMIASAFIGNILIYLLLIRLTQKPAIVLADRKFPELISNKKTRT